MIAVLRSNSKSSPFDIPSIVAMDWSKFVGSIFGSDFSSAFLAFSVMVRTNSYSVSRLSFALDASGSACSFATFPMADGTKASASSTLLSSLLL